METKIEKKQRPTEVKRTCTISVRLTNEEMEEVERAADIAGGMPKGTFARVAVIRAARAENARALGI